MKPLTDEQLLELARGIVASREQWSEFTVAGKFEPESKLFEVTAMKTDYAFGNQRYLSLTVHGELHEYIKGK